MKNYRCASKNENRKYKIGRINTMEKIRNTDKIILLNSCNFSFKNLLDSVHEKITLAELYALSQEDRNKTVKTLCVKAGWFYKDVAGKDGIVYTAFSPSAMVQEKLTDSYYDCLKN